jgi:3-hydroxyisobutyrate dehydrogenase-like beta-hydroxyacid dehydrogenase
MGSALARALIGAGHAVSVWNRSPEKAEPFHGQAKVAGTAAEALASADLAVVCLLDYPATFDALAGAGDAVAGRTVLQLSTGTPSDARAGAAWAAERSADYLDGAILDYPSGIGGDATVLCYSGPKAVYDRHETVLRAFGGAGMWVGDAVGAASAIDAGVLQFYYGACLAFIHGAAVCESEDFPLDAYTGAVEALLPVIAHTARTVTGMLAAGDVTGTDCSLDVHAAALRNIVRLYAENGIDAAFPTAVSGFFERAVAAGHGSDEMAAIFSTIKRTGGTPTA